MIKKQPLYLLLGLVLGLILSPLIFRPASAMMGHMMNHSNTSESEEITAGTMNHMDQMMDHDSQGHSDSGNLSGDAFDHWFVDEMIMHHQGAIDMAQEALEKSDREQVRELAREIVKDQTKEINQMERWHRLWWGE